MLPTCDPITWRLIDQDPALAAVTVRPFTTPATVLAAATPVLDVEATFRSDPALRSIVTWWQGRWQLLTRARLDAELAGRYGFGRALLARRPLAALLPLDTVVVRGDTLLTTAAESAIARATGQPDLVVADGGAVGLVPLSTVLAALADSYREAALTDPLTRLPNRLAVQSYDVRLGDEHNRAVASALLYVDLDRFKDVNDTYGHRTGDAVLVEFAARLRSCTRQGDVIARVGGDEFVVLVPTANEAQACALADRIVDAAAAPFVVDGHVITIGASVGVALPGQVGAPSLFSTDVLLNEADVAMYSAKSAGRGRWARLDSAGRVVGPPLARRLRTALEDGRLELHYQPKTELRSGLVVEVEALCRWSEPDLGSIPPGTFIPLAEQIGLIVPLGAWVLEQACRQAREWLNAGRELGVAVNVSAVQLAREDFVIEVAEVLRRTGLPAGRLRLEITESAALTDPAAAIARLQRLADLGVLLSLDDFGTGYSSLSVLRSLPVHGLKIDKSFIDGVADGGADAAMVEMLVLLAHRLGLTVIAEGVERDEQLAVLRELGCDAVQGYLLGRPVPADQLVLDAVVG